MEQVQLGASGLNVSRVAFGCMSTVSNGTYDGVEEAQAVAAIHAALERGINLFDTAPAYGNGASEELLGRALRGRRDGAVIADKISSSSLDAEEVRRECEKSLKRLEVETIDLYQIHWPKDVVPIEETLRAMEKLVTDGKVRALGVCNFGVEQLSGAIETGAPLVSNQVVYSLLARAVEVEVAEVCDRAGLGLLCYSPVAQGLLADRFGSADEVPEERARTRHFSSERPQARHGLAGCEAETFEALARVRAVAERLDEPMADVALAWLLRQPGVACVLVGASRPDQVERNARATELSLKDEDLAELSAATEAVKTAMGPSLDMWATPSRVR